MTSLEGRRKLSACQENPGDQVWKNLTCIFFLEKWENAGRKDFYVGSNKLAGPKDSL